MPTGLRKDLSEEGKASAEEKWAPAWKKMEHVG